MNYSQPTPPFLKRNRPNRLTSSKSRVDPLQGTVVLGRYRINSKLSQGGMSTVYLARDFEKGGLFAVKVIRPEIVRDPEIQGRVMYESQAIQRINHPAVIKIHDVSILKDEQICLVMEYVHGASLRRLVRGAPVRPSKVIPIAAAIAEGLNATHEKQIIHRDLKPENILIPRETTNTLVKIIDFGIARIIDAPKITTTQHIMGTPEYIAPEQALGQPVDQRADIYSLGVLMYEMLTGSLPFPITDPDALLHHHVHTPPLRLVSEAKEPIPDSLTQLVMACMSKKPWDRPFNMEEVVERLSRIDAK